MHPMKRIDTKKRGLILGAVAVVAVAGGILWQNQPSRLEREAARLAGCWFRGDAACVLAYADASDRQAYQLDEAKMKRLMSESLAVMSPENGRVEVVLQPDASTATGSTQFRSLRGRIIGAGFLVTETPEGYRSPGLVTSILLTLSVAHQVPDGLTLGGEQKLRAWGEFARAKGPRWTEIGFPGILRDPQEGLIPWDKWATSCDPRLARAVASRPPTAAPR